MNERPEVDDDLDELEEPGGEVINLSTTVDPLLSQWARFRDEFAEAIGAEGFWTVEDLEQRIAHRRAFFFPGSAAAMIGQVEAYPGGQRVLQMLWCVGDLAEIVRMAPGVEAVARMMGCTGMLVEGRQAWARVLKSMGYELWSVTLYKEL